MKWSPSRRRERGRPKFTWVEGIRGLMGEKLLMEEDWKGRGQLEEEDNIIVRLAQEDMAKLCQVLNSNNNNNN